MIYYTGDIHGNPREIVQFCDRHKLTEQDTLVLLGDVGANYFLNGRDAEMKQLLTQVKPTLLCIHGNHEVRPSTLPSYQTKEWNGGTSPWGSRGRPSRCRAPARRNPKG